MQCIKLLIGNADTVMFCPYLYKTLHLMRLAGGLAQTSKIFIICVLCNMVVQQQLFANNVNTIAVMFCIHHTKAFGAAHQIRKQVNVLCLQGR